MINTISVLYVDDEPGLLDIGKLFLERTKDFEVTTAPSASVALNLLKSNGIQAIVSDYQMTGMDGIAFLKTVRATDQRIPFILFTGKGREEIAIEAFENGADFYIQKGGEPKSQFAELGHKIHAAVDRRRADAQNIMLNRLYTVLSATNKAIVHIHDKKELLAEICRIVVDIGGFRMAWAGLVNVDNHLIEPVASYGHIEGYLDTIAISTDLVDRGKGPVGTAFRKKKPQICNDVATDPQMLPWRDGALERGYRSLASFPFGLETKNAGVLTFYASELGFFDDSIMRLLEEQSEDVSFALMALDHEQQRISAECDLKKSELQYRLSFDTAQDGILILDGTTGKIINANKFIRDRLGYPQDYFVGKNLWELGVIKDKTLVQKSLDELHTNKYIRYKNLSLETKQGTPIEVEFIGNVYFEDDRKIIMCNIRDITDRKLVEQKLTISEIRYRTLFETTKEGILILDGGTGAITDANPFILYLLGYKKEDMIGRKLWEIGFIRDRALAEKTTADLKKNEYVRYEDLPLETKDGRSINVEFICNVYTLDNSKVIQCNIREITDRKRREA